MKFISNEEKDISIKKALLFKELCKNMRIQYSPSETFVYSPDFFILQVYTKKNLIPLGNITINYERIINKGILNTAKKIDDKLNSKNINEQQYSFLKSLMEVYEGINLLIERYLSFFEDLNKKFPSNNNIKELIEFFSNIPLKPARSFKEALQAILFINSLLWTEGSQLVGLGRLDQILYPFLERDLKNKIITEEECYYLIKDFLKSLNKGYNLKSSALLGDTGQVIILGGKNRDGSDSTNILTYIILDTLKELKLPDPKLVLRIHQKTPFKVWQKSLTCILDGLGYPLFSNDDIIIPALNEFGYSNNDTYDYATSACWEPLIPGKSLDQNNLANINFLEPLNIILEECYSEKIQTNTFNDFLYLYKNAMNNYIEKIIVDIESRKFEPSPILSLFIDGCIDSAKDISDGGAIYNNYGLLSLAMGNTVNALLNIKRVVFEDKKLQLSEIYTILSENFKSNEILLADLQNKGLKYGTDKEEVIEVTNKLIKIVSDKLENTKNNYGFKYKFGLSSPGFVSDAHNFPASFDGRKANEPFGVHISPLLHTANISYTEITNFASSLSYKKAFNGNVTDIMAEKGFISNIKEDFIDLIKVFFQKGGMQMQINVLNPKMLIEAKKDPNSYPNLIVRVWGFSTYFNDLPEEYKDIIIERALQYESISHKYSTI